jgi:hypothetical protein
MVDRSDDDDRILDVEAPGQKQGYSESDFGVCEVG